MTQVANATDVGSFISALESARVGIRRGLSGLAADAQKIAHANVDSAHQVSDLSDALVQFAMEPMDLTPDEINQLTLREMQTWTKIVREQNIKIGQ